MTEFLLSWLPDWLTSWLTYLCTSLLAFLFTTGVFRLFWCCVVLTLLMGMLFCCLKLQTYIHKNTPFRLLGIYASKHLYIYYTYNIGGPTTYSPPTHSLTHSLPAGLLQQRQTVREWQGETDPHQSSSLTSHGNTYTRRNNQSRI